MPGHTRVPARMHPVHEGNRRSSDILEFRPDSRRFWYVKVRTDRADEQGVTRRRRARPQQNRPRGQPPAALNRPGAQGAGGGVPQAVLRLRAGRGRPGRQGVQDRPGRRPGADRAERPRPGNPPAGVELGSRLRTVPEAIAAVLRHPRSRADGDHQHSARNGTDGWPAIPRNSTCRCAPPRIGSTGLVQLDDIRELKKNLAREANVLQRTDRGKAAARSKGLLGADRASGNPSGAPGRGRRAGVDWTRSRRSPIAGAFDRSLVKMTKAARSAGTPLSLAMLDIDQFKSHQRRARPSDWRPRAALRRAVARRAPCGTRTWWPATAARNSR